LNVDASLVPGHQTLHGEMVTEIMEGGPSPLWPAQFGSVCQTGKDPLESIVGVPSLSRIDEKGCHFAVGERSITYSSVGAQDVQRRFMEWNESAFTELAVSDQQRFGFPVNVSRVQTNNFTDS
jgi:hypothetical protein